MLRLCWRRCRHPRWGAALCWGNWQNGVMIFWDPCIAPCIACAGLPLPGSVRQPPLFPTWLHPPTLPQLSEQEDVDLDADYLGALTAARSALGLDDVLPELAASREDRLVGW